MEKKLKTDHPLSHISLNYIALDNLKDIENNENFEFWIYKGHKLYYRNRYLFIEYEDGIDEAIFLYKVIVSTNEIFFKLIDKIKMARKDCERLWLARKRII